MSHDTTLHHPVLEKILKTSQKIIQSRLKEKKGGQKKDTYFFILFIINNLYDIFE